MSDGCRMYIERTLEKELKERSFHQYLKGKEKRTRSVEGRRREGY